MSDAKKKTTPNARKKAVGAEIEARLTDVRMARRRSFSIRCAKYMSASPKTKPFDEHGAWRSLVFWRTYIFRARQR